MKLNDILDLLYPPKCPFCGKIRNPKEEIICDKCKKNLPFIKEPRCMKCGKPVRKMEEEYCYDCRKQQHYFEEGRSLWIHKEPVSTAIYSFKYHSLKCYGIVLGKEMAKEFANYLKEKEIELIIPIPLNKKRLKQRGYNQAEILAKEISRETGIPMNSKLLIRQKSTKPQKQLNDRERIKNIKNAFRTVEEINAKNILLVDDIYTTGSTLNEAARILKEAGVSSVYFLTISIGQGF